MADPHLLTHTISRRVTTHVTVSGIEANLGNNGIVLYTADDSGKHVGKLRVEQATVEWCKGHGGTESQHYNTR
jgi:hypothetical protein